MVEELRTEYHENRSLAQGLSLPPPNCSSRGFGIERVFGPGVFRVPGAKLAPQCRIGGRPETFEVAGDSDGTSGW